MGKDLENQRLRQLLSELAEQNDAERAQAQGPFEPLNPALANRLLQISLAKPVARPSWLRELFLRRAWVPAVLATTTVALCVVPMVSNRVRPASWYASAPVPTRKLLSHKSAMSQAATGNTLLGGSEGDAQEHSELRVKRRDVLTLILPAVPGEKGPVAVRSFIRRDGVLQTWNVFPESRPDGSFLLLMPVRILPDLAASQELIFAYGRPDALPSLEVLRQGKPQADRRWHLLSLALFVDD